MSALASSCLLVPPLHIGGSRLYLLSSQWTPGSFTLHGGHFPPPPPASHAYIGCGRGHLSWYVERTHLPSGSVATPMLKWDCCLSCSKFPRERIQVKTRYYCSRSPSTFHSSPHMIDWFTKTLPARESVHCSGTLQPSHRYKGTGKYRKTTVSWGFFFSWF